MDTALFRAAVLELRDHLDAVEHELAPLQSALDRAKERYEALGNFERVDGSEAPSTSGPRILDVTVDVIRLERLMRKLRAAAEVVEDLHGLVVPSGEAA